MSLFAGGKKANFMILWISSVFSDDVKVQGQNTTIDQVECIEVIDKDEFQEHPVIRW